MKLYHYTHEQNVNGIREQGLLPLLGLVFLTENPFGENTVMSSNVRITVTLTDDMKKYSEHVEKDYHLLSCFMCVEMINLISDTSLWYYTDKGIKPEDIVSIEHLSDGEWVTYED